MNLSFFLSGVGLPYWALSLAKYAGEMQMQQGKWEMINIVVKYTRGTSELFNIVVKYTRGRSKKGNQYSSEIYEGKQ